MKVHDSAVVSDYKTISEVTQNYYYHFLLLLVIKQL